MLSVLCRGHSKLLNNCLLQPRLNHSLLLWKQRALISSSPQLIIRWRKNEDEGFDEVKITSENQENKVKLVYLWDQINVRSHSNDNYFLTLCCFVCNRLICCCVLLVSSQQSTFYLVMPSQYSQIHRKACQHGIWFKLYLIKNSLLCQVKHKSVILDWMHLCNYKMLVAFLQAFYNWRHWYQWNCLWMIFKCSNNRKYVIHATIFSSLTLSLFEYQSTWPFTV